MTENIKNVLTENNVEFAEMACSNITVLAIKLDDIIKLKAEHAETGVSMLFRDGTVSMSLGCTITTDAPELDVLKFVNEYNMTHFATLTATKLWNFEYVMEFTSPLTWSDDSDIFSIVTTVAKNILIGLEDFIEYNKLGVGIDKCSIGRLNEIGIFMLDYLGEED